MTYDVANRLKRTTALAGGNGLDLTYTYDLAGQVRNIAARSARHKPQGFLYDALGRLTLADGPWNAIRLVGARARRAIG